MNVFLKNVLVLFLLLFVNELSAQNNFFKDLPEAAMRGTNQKRMIVPGRYRTLVLDTASLLPFLKSVPAEAPGGLRANAAIITLPIPNGGFQQFSIVQSIMMEPGLAAGFPDIKTFSGQGIDDPTATIKLDWTPLGFHAMIFSSVSGTFAIDPYAQKNVTTYISYFKKDLNQRSFTDDLIDEKSLKPGTAARTQAACAGITLRSYRLALSCTGEYAVAVGATTKEQAFAAIATSINRVNGVYERELAVRLVLVANNLKVVFINPATDPFTQNNNGQGLLTENQKVVTDSIGGANYDIGHVFSTGGGGIAARGVVCNSSAKAQGVTGLPNPVGDAYDIDFVSHEIGHQFGANHTFNAVTGNCSGINRAAATAVEPGSGSTIMAYAGICGTNNLQANSDPYFHSVSFNEINSYVLGAGSSCAVLSSTGNTPPVANAGSDFVIPLSTPFMLTGSATDADNDALSYNWEEIDLGPSGDWNTPSGTAPLFRSFAPSVSPIRIFPKVSNLLANTVTIGELLPSYTRIMNFRLTARDNRSGGGGQCSDDMNVTVAGSGPFVVTEPNTATTWDAGDFKTITWNVANSNMAPVNCANVSIRLSTDGGLTFPVIILAGTPNDGIEEIQVPTNITTQARIKVIAVGNIFFDVSNTNFTIQTAPAPSFVFNSPKPLSVCSGSNPSLNIKTGSLGGYNTPIGLLANGNPAGSTVVFSANPVSTNSTTLVTLQGNIAPGVYNITVTGTSGSIVKNQVLQFIIGPPAIAVLNVAPANNMVGVEPNAAFTWTSSPAATSYNLLISTSSTLADTVQSLTNLTDTSYILTIPLAQDTKFYWRVLSLNSCGTGSVSAITSFITATINCTGDTVYSTNVPVTIPTRVSTVNSTLNIAAGGAIADLDVVGLKGTHTFVSDLTISLISPAGTVVMLVNRICPSQQNFDLNLNDQAPVGSITCPPTGGQVRRPAQPLSAFYNQNSTGTWRLSISDTQSRDGGELTSWGLKTCTFSPLYTFTGNGNWSSEANWKNNNKPPLILPENSRILIAPSAGQCTLDVAQVIAPGATFTIAPGKTFVVNVSLTLQ